MLYFISTDYIVVDREQCHPNEMFAESGTDLSVVESQCTIDPTCDKFMVSAETGTYYKCDIEATVTTSGSDSTLYYKGIL